MWILDCTYRDGVDLWCKNGAVTRTHFDYDPPFFFSLADPHAHHEMLDALEEHYRARPCTFQTVFGEQDGFSVHADRSVAEMIELQTQFDARLFNVDVRRDQQFLAERGQFPCGNAGESRFTADYSYDLQQVAIRIPDDPDRFPLPARIEFDDGRPNRLEGDATRILTDLFSLIGALDPDVILMSHADTWMPRFRSFAEKSGLSMPFSRNGKYRRMNSRSYWSYGRVEHKEAALIPDGRVLIDTDQSFVYREGGLDGVFMASRISGLCPNLAARFTPGTLISSYETYEAIRKGIAVPFRKPDPEAVRKLASLRSADRGGMMFQPEPGIYADVDEIDFTSMYPSIIVKFNLSPETLTDPDRPGFLPAVLDPVVQLRKETKRMKKMNARYAGIDSILKWMLVTCFGYTGYKNAKFGRIEVHEAITARSREILLQAKDLAESMGFTVIHGIVDCIWVQGSPVSLLNERLYATTGIPAEIEHFTWIVFLPLNNGSGAYNRYYGRLSDGSIKVRGIAARRHDTPEYVRAMQQEMLEIMQTQATVRGLATVMDRVRQVYNTALRELPQAAPESLAISRRISRTRYAHRCLESAAVQMYREAGMEIAPGMKIRYVVVDARRYRVGPTWEDDTIDIPYYRTLLERAWEEISYAFSRIEPGCARGQRAPAARPGLSIPACAMPVSDDAVPARDLSGPGTGES